VQAVRLTFMATTAASNFRSILASLMSLGVAGETIKLFAYPEEAATAEKLQAMVTLRQREQLARVMSNSGGCCRLRECAAGARSWT
jgi:membrane glycosyltransferase